VLYTVEEIQSILHPVFENEGVIKAVLFGSYAKGIATERSDIDIAALVDDEMSILNFCGIADMVIKALGKNVDFLYANDIIPNGKIDLELKKDGVVLYERSVHRGQRSEVRKTVERRDNVAANIKKFAGGVG